MDISNAYRLHQQTKELHEEKAEVQKEIRRTNFAYILAFVGTFVVYFIFVWMMYVSDLWGFSTWLTQNLSEIAALVIYGVLAIALPLAMSLIKEIGYKHFAKYPNSIAKVVSIVGILAFAGVVYESISSSSQQQHISRSAAESSKTFQALSNTQINVMGSSISGTQIATASQLLARCEEKLKQGKEKHCEGDRAKLKALKQSQADHAANQANAAVSAMETKTKAIADLKEDAYKPVFKAIRDSFGVSIDTGVMVVTLFVSIIFEISHLLLILFLSQKLKRLENIKQAIIQTESNYLSMTGKTFKLEDFKDSSVLDMDDLRGERNDEYREPYKDSSFDFGFAPNRASLNDSEPSYGSNGRIESYHTTPRFKWQQKQQNTEKQILGFIGFTNPNQKRASPETSTYNRELSTHGIHSPDDETLNQEADKAGIQRIIEKGLKATDRTSKPRVDPAHGLSDNKPRIEPRARGFQETSTGPAHGVSEQPEPTRQAQTSNGHESLYPLWVQAVQGKKCRASVDGTRKWIQKKIAPLMTGSKTNDLKRIDGMRKAFFSRAMREGLMKLNNKYRNGGKKYLWIG